MDFDKGAQYSCTIYLRQISTDSRNCGGQNMWVGLCMHAQKFAIHIHTHKKINLRNKHPRAHHHNIIIANNMHITNHHRTHTYNIVIITAAIATAPAPLLATLNPHKPHTFQLSKELKYLSVCAYAYVNINICTPACIIL